MEGERIPLGSLLFPLFPESAFPLQFLRNVRGKGDKARQDDMELKSPSGAKHGNAPSFPEPPVMTTFEEDHAREEDYGEHEQQGRWCKFWGDLKFSSSFLSSLIGDSAKGSHLDATLAQPPECIAPLSNGDCGDTPMHLQA